MYSPTLGRFINQDPGLTPLPGGGMVAVTPGTIHPGQMQGYLIQRPYAGRGYHDGMNLYAGHFIPNKLDPSGLVMRWLGDFRPDGCVEVKVSWDSDLGAIHLDTTRLKPEGCDCCETYGVIQHAVRYNGRSIYDNGSLDGDIGSPSDPDGDQPGERDRPSTPTPHPATPGGGSWQTNPWHGGPAGPDLMAHPNDGNPTNPHDWRRNPRPQEDLYDAPNDARYSKYIAQLVCAETGKIVFEWEYEPKRFGGTGGRMRH